MSIPDSTTHWRDQPLVPNYEDLAALVKMARKARLRLVDFDWVFNEADLRRLRRAVFEWGSTVVGRYKCFDARVLKKINEALRETDSPWRHVEPKGTTSIDCVATCVRDGEAFHLRGHASFDVVFGYGSAGVRSNALIRELLGPAVQDTLVTSVSSLGWDVRRLQEEYFRGVMNALYNGKSPESVPALPSDGDLPLEVDVHFHGPFSAVDDGHTPCVFTNELAAKNGVYLWAVTVDGQSTPWYVGHTRRGFGQRLCEHLTGMLSGDYPTYDAVALSRGECRLVTQLAEQWPQKISALVKDYDTMAPRIGAMIRAVTFYLAPLQKDARMHERVEGAIGRYYKKHPNYRDFFYPGLKLPGTIPHERPIRIRLTSDAPLAGLPSELKE